MQDNIIVKPSVEKQFDRFLRQGRVLFFSAPCGFGKTAVAEALLSSREVLRLSADSAGFKLPSAEADWQILLLDDLQDMQEEQDWNALCELIRACPERRFVLLSRGTPPGSLMAFQYTGLMTVLEADDLLFDDPLIGQKLGVRLLMEVDAVQFRASREHIEVALPKLRRPFGSLLLMGYDADQPKGFILLPQNIDDLCGV